MDRSRLPEGLDGVGGVEERKRIACARGLGCQRSTQHRREQLECDRTIS
jgi:hypothetical protein